MGIDTNDLKVKMEFTEDGKKHILYTLAVKLVPRPEFTSMKYLDIVNTLIKSRQVIPEIEVGNAIMMIIYAIYSLGVAERTMIESIKKRTWLDDIFNLAKESKEFDELLASAETIIIDVDSAGNISKPVIH